MKITKLMIFGLAFLIGSLSIWLVKSLTESKNELPSVAQKLQTNQIATKIEKPQLPVFNVEGFWDKAENQHNRRLLETGELTNVEDIKAKSGETWFGLFNYVGEDFLRATKIKISSKWEHNFDWKIVSVKEKTNPIFLVKKSKNLKEGKIRTLLREKTQHETDKSNESATIRHGFVRNFNLDGREYTLRAEKGLSEKREPIVVLLLETENTTQIIHYIYFSDEGDYVGNLYWVGDLDSDGKLDLFMDFYGYEKGGYSSALFLSSEADKGKLVKKLEYFALSAC
jgi:hypothetical protein